MHLTFASAPPELVVVLIDAAVKGVWVLAIACIAVGCMQRSSGAARHLVWFLAVASLPALPILSSALPEWNILPGWFSIETVEQAGSAQPIPAAFSPAPGVQEVKQPTAVAQFPRPEQVETIEPALPVVTTASPQAGQTRQLAQTQRTTPPAPRRTPWHLLVFVWTAGIAMTLLPVALGQFSLWGLLRHSRREKSAWWLDTLRQLTDCLKFRRQIILLKTERRRMPMTWGVLRPKLLLPEDSDQWSEERRRVVLLHELAHAKRWDYLTNLVTHFACALHWYNPMVWIAAHRMRARV